MKRKLLSSIFIILTLLFVSSCDKVSDNGDIDGMWQLVRVEGGMPGIKYTGDTADDMHYWSFGLSLMQLSTPQGDVARRYYSRFTVKGTELCLYDFFFQSANETEEDNNEWMTLENCSIINEWGLNPEADPERAGKVRQRLHIEKLTEDIMILSSDSIRLSFRKF